MSGRATAEAIVIGAGVIGTSIALFLSRSGVKTTVVERDHICAGTTGQSGGLVRQHYSQPWTAALARDALAVFRDWETLIGGDPGFVQSGVLFVCNEAAEESLRANVAMHRSLGIQTELLNPAEIARFEPRLVVDDLTIGCLEPTAGYADPVSTTYALADAARAAGAEIREGITVTSVRQVAGRVTGVETTAGPINTQVVVYAAGVWGVAMLAEMGHPLPITVTRHPMVALRRPTTDRPLHRPVLDVAIDTYLIPRGDVTLVGTLGTHADDAAVDPDTYRRGISNDEADRLSLLGRRRMPALGRGVMWGGWAGIYDESIDAHPVVDAVPGIDGLFCALGMSGNCFKLAPKIGELLARRIVDGPSAAGALAPLCIDRFAVGATHTRSFAMSVLA